MGITREETAKVAELAKLSFTPAEFDTLCSQLDRIPHFMQKLPQTDYAAAAFHRNRQGGFCRVTGKLSRPD